jgi:ribosome maturation factor RimP
MSMRYASPLLSLVGWASGPPFVLHRRRGDGSENRRDAQLELSDRIADLIQPTVEDLGFDLVRVLVRGKQRPVLEIMAEPLDGRPMTVDGCAEISRAVSALLDVDDIVAESFTLEVTSPGIDRPLVRLRDFERFAGLEAKVEMARPVDGRRRFRGRLLGVDGNHVRLQFDETTCNLAHADIQRAKLVLSDELLAQTQEQ